MGIWAWPLTLADRISDALELLNAEKTVAVLLIPLPTADDGASGVTLSQNCKSNSAVAESSTPVGR
jgi:hypothetical protein